MGLFDFVKNQFIEVIEATDFQQDMIVFEFPVAGHEIKMGAQLIVREGQCAIFLNEGTLADVFGPGHYTLSTENMPVLSKLKAWKYGFNSPFKAEVYFLSTRLFTNQKWGTSNPVLLRDAEFGMIRLMAYGLFSYKVARPEVFLREIFGSLPSYTTQGIADYLRRMIASSLSDVVGELKIPAIDIASEYDEIGEAVRERMQSRFAEIGLELQTLVVENISLPENVEKAIDQRTSMGVLGDMGKYTQYQTAEAIRDAAKNGGGIAGMGVGLGAGVQIGQAFGAGLAGSAASPAPAAGTISCAACGRPVAAEAKFCPHCGKPPRGTEASGTEPARPGTVCPKCGAQAAAGAKFCASCGEPLRVVCAKCGAEVTGKFCAECGAPRP